MLRKLGTVTILATHSGWLSSLPLRLVLTYPCQVNQVGIADHILLLNETGHVVKQGAPDTLSIPDEYTRKPSVAAGGYSGEAVSVRASSEPVKLATEEANLSEQRQVGDIAIYKYYFASLGWFGLTVFFISVVLEAALNAVKCKDE